MTEAQPEVAVVGDGPAGSALAAALHHRGVSVVLIGPDHPWTATYGTWTDDIDTAEVLGGDVDVWRFRTPSVRAHFGHERTIERSYGVLDNEALRRRLRAGVTHRSSEVRRPDSLTSRIVIDATGWPSSLVPPGPDAAEVGWQTALGVVLREPPDSPLGTTTLMDYSEPPDPADGIAVPTFAYALPVEDGWLVEETVLTARPVIDPDRLAERLASRLESTCADLFEASIRIERVRIPMGVPPARANGNVLSYGAAAGMINPTTGYSIASSLGSAAVVAARLAEVLDTPGPVDSAALDAAVWPSARRRTRALHDYGLSVLGRLDADGTCAFFNAFFDLPQHQWSAYLRIDARPATVMRTMLAMFGRADNSLRTQLVRSNPRPFARVVWPRR